MLELAGRIGDGVIAGTGLLPEVIAGASPGVALPTGTCQATCGLAIGLNSGSGAGFLLLENQSNDGGGIEGIHDASDEQPPSASAASTTAIGCTAARRRCAIASVIGWRARIWTRPQAVLFRPLPAARFPAVQFRPLRAARFQPPLAVPFRPPE